MHAPSPHSHGHKHAHGSSLGLAIFLNGLITIAQALVGLSIGSLSLLSDALHNFSDVFSLMISYIASKLSQRACTPEQTFGYKRAEIMAALLNVSSLLVIAAFIIKEALERLQEPSSLDARWIIALAALGILVNGVSVLIIKKEAEDNLNIRSAYLHLFTDMLSSLAVLLGACLMQWWQIFWLDSLLSVIIAVYLVYASWGMLMQTMRVLMQFSPPHIDLAQIQVAIQAFPVIENIHHVHIWQINDREVHFEAHVDFKEDLPLSQVTQILRDLKKLLAEKFHIHHTLLQAEYGIDDAKSLIADERSH